MRRQRGALLLGLVLALAIAGATTLAGCFGSPPAPTPSPAQPAAVPTNPPAPTTAAPTATGAAPAAAASTPLGAASPAGGAPTAAGPASPPSAATTGGTSAATPSSAGPATGAPAAKPPAPPAATGSGSAPVSTPFFANYWGNATLDGQRVPVGATVEAFNPRGDLVGRFTVNTEGYYGYMRVFGEETISQPPISGMRAGETVTFKINGKTAETTPSPATWQNSLEPAQLDLAAR